MLNDPKSLFRRARRSVALALALVASVAPVAASAADCYSPAEYEAEQALRLQSELTVIAYGCPTPPGAIPLAIQYGQFVKSHQKQFAQWQGALRAYLRKTERGNVDRHFDNLASLISNQLSNRQALVSPLTFCANEMARFDALVAMKDEDLLKQVRDNAVVRISSRPPCRPVEVELREPEVVQANLRVLPQ
jgi:hypothetical protein